MKRSIFKLRQTQEITRWMQLNSNNVTFFCLFPRCHTELRSSLSVSAVPLLDCRKFSVHERVGGRRARLNKHTCHILKCDWLIRRTPTEWPRLFFGNRPRHAIPALQCSNALHSDIFSVKASYCVYQSNYGGSSVLVIFFVCFHGQKTKPVKQHNQFVKIATCTC